MRFRPHALFAPGLLGLALSGSVPALARDVHPPAQHAPVRAQVPVDAHQIEVLVIEGSAGAGGISPDLSHLSQLTRPPFNGYTQMSLVSRTVAPLGPAPSMVALPNGNTAEMVVEGRQPNGRIRVHVALTFSGRTHNIVFAASPGEPFFTVRPTGPDTARILGFIIR